MEKMKKFYKNKKVLVTGATGFKGAWLCSWLLKLMRPVFRRFSIGVVLVLATEFCTGPMLAESVEHDQDKVEEIILIGKLTTSPITTKPD